MLQHDTLGGILADATTVPTTEIENCRKETGTCCRPFTNAKFLSQVKCDDEQLAAFLKIGGKTAQYNPIQPPR